MGFMVGEAEQAADFPEAMVVDQPLRKILK